MVMEEARENEQKKSDSFRVLTPFNFQRKNIHCENEGTKTQLK